MPALNQYLRELHCSHNLSPILIHEGFLNEEEKNNINNISLCLERFKMTFYCLKYKTKLQNWLWVKVRLPKIKKMYHPNNLNELLYTGNNMTEEEFDDIITNW